MNMFASLKIVKLAALGACCLALAARAENKPAPAKAESAAPKSAFVNDPEVGKDPFFPHSTRRLESMPRLATTNAVAPSSLLWNQLALKGICGTKGEPLALINGVTVSIGELAEIKFGRQIVKVRCREIRERSIVLQLDGSSETRELKLREGI
jgi:hypothetical protein